MARLDDLPIKLLVKIFALMPIRYAVRTSSVCRFFRRIWILIPQLRFVETDNSPVSGSIINKVFSKHEPTVGIQHFELFTTETVSAERWIEMISCRETAEELKTLSLSFYNRHPNFRLPCSYGKVFLKLTRLVINNCLITLQYGGEEGNSVHEPFPGFPCLVSLEMEKVEFRSYSHLQELISACRALQNLTLRRSTPQGILRISLPNLHQLTFWSVCDEILLERGISFQNLTISINYMATVRLTKLFQDGIVCQGKLHLDTHTMQALSESVLPQIIPSSFQRLNHLSIELNVSEKKEVSLMIYLTRMASNVQQLSIKITYNDNGPKHFARNIKFWRRQHLDLFNTIKIVNVDGILLDTSGVNFLLFLVRARGLETLKVSKASTNDNVPRPYIIQHVKMFTQATIVYNP